MLDMKLSKMILGGIVVLAISLSTFNNVNAHDIRADIPGGNYPNELVGHQPLSERNVRGLMSPSLKNFEYVSSSVALAINTINISRLDGDIDLSDLKEDYRFFDYRKYLEVQNGTRVYKYLKLEPYWNEQSKVLPNIRAVVIIPHSQVNNDAVVEYLNNILNILQNQYHINTEKIGTRQKHQIVNDISNSSRFTCVKVLRFIWMLFGDYDQNKDGLFPQVYQLNFVKAGELSHFVAGGNDLFNGPHTLQPALLSHSVVTNYDPEKRPKIFENRIAVFFRPSRDELDTGHVGIGQIFFDDFGTKQSKISYIDVNGETGMAKFVSRISLKDFRNNLYSIQSNKSTLKPNIGWYLNY